MTAPQESARGFRITRGRGFHLTFANGYTASVQFGPGNYSDPNYDADDWSSESPAAKQGWPATTAEIAGWGPDGEMIEWPGWDEVVRGYVSPDGVLAWLSLVASQSAPLPAVTTEPTPLLDAFAAEGRAALAGGLNPVAFRMSNTTQED